MQQWARLVTCSVASLLVTTTAGAAPLYSLRAIDPGEPETETVGMSLNDRGEVTGLLNQSNAANRAFIWDGSGPARPLPVAQGHGAAINNLGEVVGISKDGPFIWSAAGGTRILPAPPGYTHFTPQDVNDAGTIVGAAGSDVGGLVRRFADGTTQAVPWFPLGAWPADSMNRHGAVAGRSNNQQTLVGAAVWEPDGTLRPIPQGSRATAINDDGWVAGTYFDGQKGGLALWAPDGRRVNVPDVPGAQVSSQVINGINNRRELVGYLNHTNHDDDAFYWSEATGTIDLQNYLDESGQGWDLQLAVDVNESGQILAWAWRGQKGGGRYGVLLTPVPEPSVLLGAGIPLAALLIRRPPG